MRPRLVYLLAALMLLAGCRSKHPGWSEGIDAPYRFILTAGGRDKLKVPASHLAFGVSKPEQVEAFVKTFPLPLKMFETEQEDGGTPYLEADYGELRLIYRFEPAKNTLQSITALHIQGEDSPVPDRLLSMLTDAYGRPDSVEPFEVTVDGEKVTTDITISHWQRAAFRVSLRVPKDTHREAQVIVLEFRAP
ncbi:MAG: hypothetical protein KC910_34910 [Candidatus Eremiobacteraeota bacterium]|nr:hypothetical protein [Candidatus Eremiobacteraeota bacterium]